MQKKSNQEMGGVCTHLAIAFLSMLLVLASAPPALADGIPGKTILFQDLTDTVGVDLGGSARIINNGGCTTTFGENCSFDVVAPPGYTLYRFFGADPSTTTRVDVNIGEPVSSDNPNFGIRSDGITAIVLDSQTVFINYNSDPQPGVGGDTQFDFNCSQTTSGTCDFFENGLPQTAGTLVWVPLGATGYSERDVVDHINFQSDTNAVPEPRLRAFLVIGLAGFGFFARRKLAAARG